MSARPSASGKRYMSNITIVEHQANSLRCRAMSCSHPWAAFRKAVCSPARMLDLAAAKSAKALSAISHGLFESNETPRLSGVQIKAPMNLDEEGN